MELGICIRGVRFVIIHKANMRPYFEVNDRTTIMIIDYYRELSVKKKQLERQKSLTTSNEMSA